jgi:hypothetical protein
LSLVKSTASEEECKQIFENDKKIHMKRKILKRKQKSSGIAGQSQALVEGALDVVKVNIKYLMPKLFNFSLVKSG